MSAWHNNSRNGPPGPSVGNGRPALMMAGHNAKQEVFTMTMQEKYTGFEIHYPADHPQANGKYFGKTPIFEQALKAAQSIGGALYGITPDGTRVFILY